MSPARKTRILRTARGARVVCGDVVLSEVLDHPGPTHTLFDLLAACVAALSPGPRVALLGFAAGGLIAPLRAMGFRGAVEAADLSLEGARLFRKLSGKWAEPVSVARGDAVAWLKGRGGKYDAVFDDLSISGPAGVTKPYASIEALPPLMASRLRAGGVGINNLLPLPGTTWASLLAGATPRGMQALVVTSDEYVNRVLVWGASLPDARTASRGLRGRLAAIGSSQSRKTHVRRLS